MKWQGRRQSNNVEDRRGMSKGGGLALGGGAVGIIFLLIQFFMGDGDVGQLVQQVQQQVVEQQASTTATELSAEDQKMGEFVSVVLADTEQVWNALFAENNANYREPKLVLFRDAVSTQCGNATAAAGPFYCPADEKVYMDMAFFEELQTRFGAKGGDFAIAYVIAHEVGHHVQTVIGTSSQVRKLQGQASKREANKLSVALELQADFYAGIWTHYNEKYNKVLESGDIDEALSAANAVGDDAIQRRVSGDVQPDSFTHGTSEQRMYWFTKGFQTGDLSQGDYEKIFKSL